MRSILFDVLEINIVMTLVILLLCLFAGKIRKRYGAMWLKVMWIVLMVRLLIPYNFSLPVTEFRLLNEPGFEQEMADDLGSGALNSNAQNIQPELNADAMQSSVSSQTVSVNNAGSYEQNGNFGSEMSQMNSESVVGDIAEMVPEGAEGSIEGMNQGNASSGTVGVSGGQPEVGSNPAQSDVSVAGADDIATGVENTDGDAGEPGPFRYTDILLYVWLIGIGVSAIYHIVVYLVMRRTYMKDLEPVKNASLQEEIDKLQKKYLGEKRLAVYESKQVQSPLITGILRPKLIIPAYEDGWDMNELELITAHELCHYRKKDLWLKMLMLAVTCFNWFNPAVYMMKKQFYYDMELVCDESVMRGRSKEEKETYAKILMSYAVKNRRNYTFMSGLAAGNKLTKNRIYHIWEDGKKKKGVVVFAVILVGFLGVSVFVSCGYKPGEVKTSGMSSAVRYVGVEQNKEHLVYGSELGTYVPTESVDGDIISYGDEVSFAWEDVEGLCFQCPSLNGEYPTWLHVAPDGSFSGSYKELFLEDTGEEYPNGTIYLCNFDGKFAEPKEINAYTYSLEVSTMTYEEFIGSHIYKDGFYYYYVWPAGLYDLEELVLYTPGAPLSELPAEFLESVGYNPLSVEEDATLPFYGIYNVKEEYGFCSFYLMEEVWDLIGDAEDFALQYNDMLANDTVTEAQYIEVSKAIWEQWELTLDYLIYTLNMQLDGKEIVILKAQNEEWITARAQEVEEYINTSYANDPLESMYTNLKMAEITRERVYELWHAFEGIYNRNVAPEELFIDTSVVETDESGNVLLYTMQYEVQPGELCQIKLYGKTFPNSTYGISYVEITSEDGKDYSFATEEAMTEVWGEKAVYTECWNKDGGIKLEDVNFDGYVDIGLMARIPAYNLPYIYYFFNAETGKYEYYDFFPMYFTVDAEAETCSISHHAGTIYFEEVWGKDNAGGLYLMQQTVRDYDYFTGEFTETTEYYSLEE